MNFLVLVLLGLSQVANVDALRVERDGSLGKRTNWIGPDPSYFVSATTNSGGASTVTKGAKIDKSEKGGVDIIISPAIKDRLEQIAEEIPSCGGRRFRRRRRDACGLPEFRQRLLEDQQFREHFNQQFSNDLLGAADESCGPTCATNSEGWAGDEALIIGTEEEALIAEALIADGGSMFPGVPIAAGTFLTLIWSFIEFGRAAEHAYHIPEDRIHTITRKKEPTATTSNPSCPTTLDNCPTACKLTSSVDPKETEVVYWKCGEGDKKDCACNPRAIEAVNYKDVDVQKIIWMALDEYDNGEQEYILQYNETEPGKAVKDGVKLRILAVGDSITAGFASEKNGGDGDGYRRRLKDDLSKNKAVFAGTESSGVGTMEDGYFAAWSGQTIQYIADRIEPSLKHRPNVILLAAGTNDMNESGSISKQGNDPKEAIGRLSKLVDKMIEECPDATILVSMIIDVCHTDNNMASQLSRTQQFRELIPDMVRERFDDGHHVLAVDFGPFDPKWPRDDCVHPSNDGYKDMGDWWYDFIHQIPQDWLNDPEGKDPDREDGDGSNGGLDKSIPPPDWGTIPINDKPASWVKEVADWAKTGDTQTACKGKPLWKEAGKIALGVGSNGDWKFHKHWALSTDDKWGGDGKVADGIGKDPRYVRLVDMDGDGKADYVWVDPQSGEIICWINNLPGHWSPAGNNKGIIGSGVKGSKYIYLADMNGDGKADYLVVNPDNGSVKVWWNYGPDDNWVNGWKFVEGGEIASGVRHANLATLRFPDINGDGRADYVYIGQGGALRAFLNVGGKGSTELLFHAQGGIATGAVKDISKLVFADMNGDRRDDYLIWDNNGGLTGFLNQKTNHEGVPVYIDQGPEKTIADGIGKDPKSIRLADMDGDGKDDYAYIGENGSVQLWYNRGETDDNLVIDGLRFADVDGDGADDYIYLDPKSGAPISSINKGPNEDAPHGWLWEPLNGGKPIASGAGPASQVKWGDVDGDGLSDYLVLDPKSGELSVYKNADKSKGTYGWAFEPLGVTASGLGPGRNVRFADIDGDGLDDYIYLKENGGTIIYRSVFDNPDHKWEALPDADASGIGQRPEEIELIDINGDGKADYVWKKPIDGSVRVWINEYPNLPAWRDIGIIAEGVGTSGNNIRWATLQEGGRPDYIIVDPKTGALGAWLNGCEKDDLAPPLLIPNVPPVCNKESDFPGHVNIGQWTGWAWDFCNRKFGNIDKRVNPGYHVSGEEWDEFKHKVRFSITWREGCTVSKPRKDMDVLNPMEDYSVRCGEAFATPWKYCWDENNGVGAYQDIRCLRYQVDAGV
ncbi:hypothetical protein ACHAPT_008521 [Fusarium lateritium]